MSEQVQPLTAEELEALRTWVASCPESIPRCGCAWGCGSVRRLLATIDALTAKLAEAERERKQGFEKLENWLANGCPEPALAFTAGPERRLADFIRGHILALSEAAAQAEALRGALERYGKHSEHCAVSLAVMCLNPRRCTCGLDAALASAPPQTAAAEGERSPIPCARCGGPCVEFVVPNDVWNTVVRRGGPERDDEYLCESCFRTAVVEYVRDLQPAIAAHPPAPDAATGERGEE